MTNLFSRVNSFVAVPYATSVGIRYGSFVQAFCASWLIALSAQVTVPFYPIPMTMQPFSIMLIALLVTWPTAVIAVLLYLSYATMGLPVLAGGNNLLTITPPTTGYLVGFVLMSWIISLLMQHYKGNNVLMYFVFALIGQVFLFVPGVGFLTYLFSWNVAVKTGLLPFLLSMPTETALAVYLSVWIKANYLAKIH